MIEIEQLLKITNTLKERYHRGFTLDGKLVGDIGEVLAAEKYRLDLLPENTPVHDAIQQVTGRKIQIKASFQYRSYFSCKDVPVFFIAIQIFEDGSIRELFNGPGEFIAEHYIRARGLVANRRRYLFTLSGKILQELNAKVPIEDKIKAL